MGERLVDDALGQVGRLFKENAELRARAERAEAELTAHLEAESADAAAGSYAGRAEEAEAERDEQRTRANIAEASAAALRGQRDAAKTRAEKAEVALAELRGRYEVQWATRVGDDSDGIPARYYPDDEDTCRRRAAVRYGEPHQLVQRDIYPGPWRRVGSGRRPALERAADEQGVPLVCGVDKLTAPKGERLSDEEWAAYADALGIGTGDEQGVRPVGDVDALTADDVQTSVHYNPDMGE